MRIGYDAEGNIIARLKAVGPRLSVAAPALVRPGGEAERLAARTAERPNWYSLARWQKLRAARLRHDGWTCCQTGEALTGTHPEWNAPVVDHIVPHRWDPDLFWDFANLQSVTKQWHDSEKQRLERAGLA